MASRHSRFCGNDERRGAWGLDARLRGHDVLLAPDLRNGHLGGVPVKPEATGELPVWLSIQRLHCVRAATDDIMRGF